MSDSRAMAAIAGEFGIPKLVTLLGKTQKLAFLDAKEGAWITNENGWDFEKEGYWQSSKTFSLSPANIYFKGGHCGRTWDWEDVAGGTDDEEYYGSANEKKEPEVQVIKAVPLDTNIYFSDSELHSVAQMVRAEIAKAKKEFVVIA